MDFYGKFLTKVLATKINGKLTADKQIATDDLDAVMENITVLCEKVAKLEFGQPTGEYYQYLPKEDKEMVMRLIAPTHTLTSSCEWLYATPSGFIPDRVTKDDKRVLRASAVLYFDRNDTRPVATYSKVYELDRLFEDADSYESASIEQKSNAEGLARGIAETRCLSKFGIGEWFDNDTDPEKRLSDADNKKAAINAPVVAFDTTSPAPAASEQAKPEATQEEIPFQATLFVETPVATPVPKEEAAAEKKPAKSAKNEKAVEANSEPVAAPSDDGEIQMTLEEAKAFKATVGISAERGFTLGNIVDAGKFNNIRYIYAKTSSKRERAAVKVLYAQYPEIQKSFEEGNIVLQ